ncbi:MAG: HAD family hydrolase [Limisphaerales bacterium]
MIRNVILDWSGTLVDDLPIVMEATNAALARVGRAPMSCEEFRAEFRLPVRAFYDRLFPGLPWEALQEAFHGRFERVHERVEPLAHAREFLEFLRSAGCRVFLLTSVPDRYLHAQMGRVGWGEYFEGLWTEALDKREVIRERVEGLGLLAEETLMVGDMEHDVEAARAMGCWAAVVLTGYQFESDLLKAEPDVVVGDLAELRGGLEASGMEPFWRKNGRREEA